MCVLSSSKNDHTNFQNYCWPILGENDTTLVYKYEMSSVDYDTAWHRYFKIHAFTEQNVRYFDYHIYSDQFVLESHYKYQVDHLGIKLVETEAHGEADTYIPGKIDKQRVFEWDLQKGEICCSSMIFNNFQKNCDMTVESESQFQGNGGKVPFQNAKLNAIKFERNVKRSVNGILTVSKGVSYYAKGIGYHSSHIVLNESIEFDEVLVDILDINEWSSLQN